MGADGARHPLEATKLAEIGDSLAAARSTVVYNTFYPKWMPKKGGCNLKLNDVQIIGDLNEAKIEEQPLEVQLTAAIEKGEPTEELRSKLDNFTRSGPRSGKDKRLKTVSTRNEEMRQLVL